MKKKDLILHYGKECAKGTRVRPKVNKYKSALGEECAEGTKVGP